LPNTEVIQGASVAPEPASVRSDADRLSVTVRPAPVARPAENSNGKALQK
jgi:hypothetical protein